MRLILHNSGRRIKNKVIYNVLLHNRYQNEATITDAEAVQHWPTSDCLKQRNPHVEICSLGLKLLFVSGRLYVALIKAL